jgi:hypothetical protein
MMREYRRYGVVHIIYRHSCGLLRVCLGRFSFITAHTPHVSILYTRRSHLRVKISRRRSNCVLDGLHRDCILLKYGYKSIILYSYYTCVGTYCTFIGILANRCSGVQIIRVFSTMHFNANAPNPVIILNNNYKFRTRTTIGRDILNFNTVFIGPKTQMMLPTFDHTY